MSKADAYEVITPNYRYGGGWYTHSIHDTREEAETAAERIGDAKVVPLNLQPYTTRELGK